MKPLKERIKQFLFGKDNNDKANEKKDEKQSKSEQELRTEIQEQFQTKFDEMIGLSDNDETLIKTINQHINDFGIVYYRRWGFTDGKIGTRDFQILKTAKIQGNRITNHVKSKLSGRVEALKFAIEDKEINLGKLTGSMDAAREAYDDIKEDENDDDKQFNKFQAWICIIFGILMIASDIVVSLNLVSFFGVGTEHDKFGVSDGLWAKFTDWELLFFSLGIAFCTLYVKLLYDDYINTKFGYFSKEKNKVVRRNEGITKTALNLEYIIKLIVKLSILAALLWFLYYLAEYRTHFTAESVESVNSVIKTSGGISQVILNCFIGISVMIPVISGIALSVGFRILGRKAMMKKLKEQYDECVKEHRACHNEIFTLKSKHKELETYRAEWTKEDNRQDAIAELFANNYNQGFREGYAIEFGNDLYMLVENYRNEVINIALTDKISKYLS